MEVISLSRLNEFIRRVIALNFQDPIWIIAELVQCKLNKGHHYLELAERSPENEIIAQSSAVIWKTSWSKINKHFQSDLLREGQQIKLKIQLEFHAKFGLSLNVIDLDETFTLGEIAKQRKETIARLVEEGLWQINKNCYLPLAIKRIAIITSLTAAGKLDFETQLLLNDYKFTFDITYFPCAMQGQNVKAEICKALNSINYLETNNFDCIVIIRGGGGKLDLIEFDQYEIAESIAKNKLPVLTGIGHQHDESITDLTAFLALKTPTAVASFIIERNFSFMNNAIQHVNTIERLSINILLKFKEKIIRLGNQIYLYHSQDYMNRFHLLNKLKSDLMNSLQSNLRNKQFQLLGKVQLIDSNNPLSILEKGYSMNFQLNKRISGISDIDPNIPLETIFKDGKINSKILSNETK
ncbi:MAG: exodeoxyribonuclease VII large subunit [Saprospiraceae bacterium]